MAEAVVGGPLLRVLQALVGGADFLELDLGRVVARIAVRVDTAWRACGRRSSASCRPPCGRRRAPRRNRPWLLPPHATFIASCGARRPAVPVAANQPHRIHHIRFAGNRPLAGHDARVAGPRTSAPGRRHASPSPMPRCAPDPSAAPALPMLQTSSARCRKPPQAQRLVGERPVASVHPSFSTCSGGGRPKGAFSRFRIRQFPVLQSALASRSVNVVASSRSRRLPPVPQRPLCVLERQMHHAVATEDQVGARQRIVDQIEHAKVDARRRERALVRFDSRGTTSAPR